MDVETADNTEAINPFEIRLPSRETHALASSSSLPLLLHSNAATALPSTFNRESSTHIEGKLGDDEGTNASEGGDLGVTALDEVKDGLKLVHDFECFVFPGRGSSKQEAIRKMTMTDRFFRRRSH